MPLKSGNALIRDRTQEFLGIAEWVNKSFASPNGPSSSGSKTEEQRTATATQSEFNRRASKIGFGIHQTSQKLSKLAKLAKRTSVFDDPSMEIQEITAVIKQDITALNSAVVDLQLLSNSRDASGNISSDTTTHSTTVVDDLKNRLMSTTKEFKDVLTMRTENLKVRENRRQLFSSSASKNPTNPFVRQRPSVIVPQLPLLFHGLMGHNLHLICSPKIKWMGTLGHYFSSSKINSNSRWFHYKTATCRVELRFFKMWNLLFRSLAISSSTGYFGFSARRDCYQG